MHNSELRRILIRELSDRGDLTDAMVLELIDDLLEENTAGISLSGRVALRQELFLSVRGLDLLSGILADDRVQEIMINGYDRIFVERGGLICRYPGQFASPERLLDVIRQLVSGCNRVVNESSPIADARLPDGSRIHVVLPPVSVDGPILTIRRFPGNPLTMERLIEGGSLSEEAALLLRRLVRSGYSMMIGGGTSTGKTTFLNALSAWIPEKERIITIEDTAELQIQGKENLVRLEVKQAGVLEGTNVTIRDLIRAALRMRPDRLIVGEVRGAEAIDLLQALNTGHEGSLSTAHANSTRDMISRLEVMAITGSEEIPLRAIRHQIASGFDVLIQLERAGGSRRVREICEIIGMEGEEIRLNVLFSRDEDGALVSRNPLQREEKLKRREGASYAL